METDNNSQLPEQKPEETNQPPYQSEQAIVSKVGKSRASTKKKLLWFLLLLLIIGGAAAYYFFFMKKDTKNNAAPAPAKIEAKKDELLIYATKLAKDDKVQVKNITKNTTAEEVSFSESFGYAPESGNAWQTAKPSADLSPDGDELAYIKDDNLIVRNIDTDKEETLIKKTGSTGSPDTITAITIDPAPPKVSGPGLSLISSPAWSRDGKDIGISLGFYEGGAVQVINRTTKKYASLGDTFRYAESFALPAAKFTLLPDNKPLSGFDRYGSYLVKEETYLNGSTVTLDSKKVLAILCPVDEPSTGNSKYSEDSFSATELAQQKAQRDCGETGDRSLISIDLADGNFKEVGKGKFGSSMALQSPDVVYVGGDKTGGYGITKIFLTGATSSSSLDAKVIGELGASDNIEGTIVKNAGNTAIAEIYIKNGDKRQVKVVNLKTEKLVTSIDLETNMGYTTLGISQ